MFKKYISTTLLCSIVLLGVAQDAELFSSLKYRNIGPSRGGRSTTVTGVIQEKGTFYMGTTGGGLWKTTDYGINWRSVSDGFFETGSIGAVRVAPSDPNIVYVGTGSDGIRSNVIAGRGVYKSADAGKSWESLGLRQTGHIGAVEIHPSNPDIVFVAAIGQAHSKNKERGLFRSKDGGKNWEKVLFLSDSVGIVDFEFSPDNPSEMYASAWQVDRKPWTILSGPVGGIYKSSDGGDTWNQLAGGLPSTTVGKIDMAVSAAKPERLYALVEAPEGEGGLYMSDDRGETFKLMSKNRGILDRPFYYCNVDANPNNADAVYVNSTRFYRSYNNGKKWTTLRTPHGDNHDMWFNPSDTSIYVQANDGGANVTLNDGKSWSVQTNQPTAELYQVEVDDQSPYWLYAGQQDNSTIAVPSAPPYPAPGGPTSYWMAVGGCETGPAVPKPGDHNTVYANCKGRFGVYNKKTGQEQQYYVGAANMYGHNPKDLKFRFQRVSPIHVSPHNPDVVYHTSQYVHRTKDDGKTWEIISPDLTAFDPATQVISGYPITRDVTGEEFHSTIYAIRESSVQAGVIWVGANDGPVSVSVDNGKTWNRVTPPGIGPYGRVDSVEPSPHDANTAYVSILRYQLGDWRPYVFRTTDLGKNWTLLTDGNNGIPNDHPVRVIREDKVRKGLLFAGTEFGMFVSFDDGVSWQSFQRNLPVTPITDIKVVGNDLALSTMGRSFWIMDDISTLRRVEGDLSEVTLFEPSDATMYRYRSTGGNGVSYPNPGVIIEYYQPDVSEEDVKIEIVGKDGNLIKSFTSQKPKERTESSTSMATGFFFRGTGPSPDNKAGINRFIWDFTHSGSWHAQESRRGMGGPRTTPGKYTIRLTANGKVVEKSFETLSDPRLVESGINIEALRAQEVFNLRLRDLQSKVRYMNHRLEEVKKRLNPKKKKAYAEFETVWDEINTKEGRYQVPMLEDQIGYLSSMMRRADQPPGKDALDRIEELEARTTAIMPAWEKVVGEKYDPSKVLMQEVGETIESK